MSRPSELDVMDEFDSLINTDLVDVPALPDADAEKRPCLIVLAGSNVGAVFLLDELAADGPVVIGRRGHATLELDDDTVSRRHCSLTWDEQGQVSVQDLGSANQTLHNEEPLEGTQVLHDGDRLRLGETSILKFSLQDGVDARFQQQLYHAALRDSLTNLFTREQLMRRCELEFELARQSRRPLSFLLIDLDHFKRVNDRFGHQAGDRALAHVARQIELPAGAGDVCGRYGGEEFGVLAVDTDLAEAAELAERIRAQVRKTEFQWEGACVPISASVGVAALPDRTIESPSHLIQRADEALYRAKRAGRDLTRVYFEGHED